MLYAIFLEFRFVFALQNYGANCLRLGMKNGANFGFSGIICFTRAHDRNRFAIAQVLLGAKSRRGGKFRDVGFRRLRKVR